MYKKNYSREKREEILLYAEVNNVYQAAKEYGLPTSSIFRWRKQLGVRNLPRVVENIDSALDQLRSELALKDELMEGIRKEVEAKTLSTYQASCAFSALSGAGNKILTMQLQLQERRHLELERALQEQVAASRKDSEYCPEIRLEAERMLAYVIQEKLRREAELG